MDFFKVENQDGQEIEIQSPVFGYYVSGDKKMFVLSDHPPDELGMSYVFQTYIVNPDEHDWHKGLFLIWFGSMFATNFLVWAKGFEDALEKAAGAAWDAGMKGFFESDEMMKEYYEEAKEELGADADESELYEHSTEDLTYTETGYIPSHEWGGQDVYQGQAFGEGQDLYMAAKFVGEAYTDDSDEYRFEMVPNRRRGHRRNNGALGTPGSSDVTEALYEVVLNGFSDEFAGDATEPPFLAADLLRGGPSIADFLEKEGFRISGPDLNQIHRCAGAIVTVNDQGFRESFLFDTEADLDSAWKELEAELYVEDLEPNARTRRHQRNASHYDDYIITVPRMSAQRRLVYEYNPEGDAWGSMIGLAKGYNSEKEAFDWCQSHAFQRGKQSALVFREKHSGDVVQVGHVGEAHRDGSYQPNARGGSLDEQAARDLELYIENTYELVGSERSQGKQIEKNLEKKIKQGKFNYELSIKLWGYLIETGAKKYVQEFGDAKDWHQMFSPATRRFVAERFAAHFAQEHGQLAQNGRATSPKGGSETETFRCWVYGHTGRLIWRSEPATSYRSLMAEADRVAPEGDALIRGELTSDGSYWAGHGGRTIAQRDGGEWLVG